MARGGFLAPSRRSVAGLLSGRSATAVLVALLGLAVYGLSSADPGLADAPSPLFLLVVPLALAAITYGVKGGVAFGLVAVGLGCVWWLQHGHVGGTAWLVSRGITVLLVGGLLGWVADSRQALTRELEKQRELSLDLIATANVDGFFTRVNPAFTRTLGYTADELLAIPYTEFVHPDDRAATLAARAAQTDTGVEITNLKNRFRTKDGGYRWLEWSSRPDPSRRTLIAVGRDITDRKLLEEGEQRDKERLEEIVAERTRQLEEARQETVERLALAADYHDDQTQQHTRRVGETAAQIAATLGLSDDDVALIGEAALLHDVGKVGITDAVLLKPGRLTPDELEHVKQHAEMGARILSQSTSEVLRAAEAIARFHHERWDGTGYPRGLRGEAIPLFARIVAVADVFDAITHTRPYKEAGTVNEAVAEIHRLSGSHFDPDVVNAFVSLDPQKLAGIPHSKHGAAPTRHRTEPLRTTHPTPSGSSKR